MNELELLELEVIKIDFKEGVMQFSNFEELKEKTQNELKKYKGLTLTEENKQDIKSLMAQLNKDARTLNQERLSIERHMFDTFKSQVNEVRELILKVRSELDTQVKAQENEERELRSNEMQNYFENLIKEKEELLFLKFEDVNLNVTLTASNNKLQNDILEFIEDIESDLEVINSNPNKTRLFAKYRLNLDLKQSLIELNNELEQEKAIVGAVEEEVVRVPETKEVLEEEILELTITIRAPKSKIIDLKNYLKENKIEHK